MKRAGVLAVVVIGCAIAQNECFAAHIVVEEDKTFTSDGVIQEGDIYRTVSVYDTAPDHTTINMTGGSVWGCKAGNGLYCFDSSIVNISGGTIDVLETHNQSTVNATGGAIGNECGSSVIRTYNTSMVNISEGGYLRGGSSAWIDLFDSSTLNVIGGDVGLFVFPSGASTVNVRDGRLLSIDLTGHSTVNMYGGYIDVWGVWGNMALPDTPTVNIYGYGFTYEPKAQWRYLENPTDGSWVSMLTGYGPDGTQITWVGLPDPSIHSNIHIIPEPTAFILLLFGGIRLARARKRA